MADLVVVSSPLQYMNAVEQRAFAADRPADLLLIGDRHGAQDAIDSLMTRKSPWRSVFRHGRRPRPHRAVPHLLRDALDAAHRASLETLAKRLVAGRYGQVVFGDYRNVSQRVIVEAVGAEEIVLLDDGSVTPQAAAFRADRDAAPEARQFDLSWFRTRLGRRMFGDRTPAEPESLCFFTIYDRLLAGRVGARDRIVGHRYESWRSGLSAGRANGEVWFLGADHVEAGIAGLEHYRRVVAGAAGLLRAEGFGPIVYRPHRGEGDAKARAVAEEAGMAFVRSGAPVEIDYLDAGSRPVMVIAVASSAADTLSVLDPELEIARVALPDGYLRRRAEHIRAVVAGHDAFNPRLRVLTPAPPRVA